MSDVTLAQIVDAIEETLGHAEGVMRSQSYHSLTEDYPDLPLMQVYPESGETDAWQGGDRSTFRAGVRVREYSVNVDIPCRQRSHIDQDMAKLVEIQEAVQTVLEEQKVMPFFGLSAIKAFRWSWQRVNFSRGDPNIVYPGVRFIVSVRLW